jgi:hypothetical protein
MTHPGLPGQQGTATRCPSWLYADARDLEYVRLLGWGWTPVDAAFAAYFRKPPALVLNPAHARQPPGASRPRGPAPGAGR